MEIAETEEVLYDKNNPFPASVIERTALTLPGSAKDVQHIVLDITGSGFDYRCGDSIGVYPQNHPACVEAVLAATGFPPDEPVWLPKAMAPIPLHKALTCHVTLAQPSKKNLVFFLEHTLSAAEQQKLQRLLDPDNFAVMQDYLQQREWVDLRHDFPAAQFSAQELVASLRRLVPRLYSIASSPTVHPNQAYLTVAVLKYVTCQQQRYGVASTYLAERVQYHQQSVPIFLAKSPFALPESDDVDVIMVGPGTGVAPFRAFVEERFARGARGRNWLFFGEQHRATDFFYQKDWRYWQAEGALTHLDLAFSRDQGHKIYVQHRLQEQADEVWRWLDKGAHFYICGDAQHMAVAVEAALLAICQRQGKMSAEGAKTFVKGLKKSKRYQRDVY